MWPLVVFGNRKLSKPRHKIVMPRAEYITSVCTTSQICKLGIFCMATIYKRYLTII